MLAPGLATRYKDAKKRIDHTRDAFNHQKSNGFQSSLNSSYNPSANSDFIKFFVKIMILHDIFEFD